MKVESHSKHSARSGVFAVIPSYNHARFVGDALRSIFRQTLPPEKLLVIDDGSRDGSPATIERLLRDCPFPCEFIARENRGLCQTLNEALERSEAEFFAYLGSDDMWLPEFLETRLNTLRARPTAALAYGHAFIIDGENRIVDQTSNWAKYADGDVRGMLLRGGAPMSPTVVYRRAALAECGWDVRAKLEDYQTYLYLSTIGEFAFDERILAAWRRHGRNASGNVAFMIEETAAAQRRLAARLGLTPAESARAHAALSWTYAEEFARAGDKAQARALALRGVRQAPNIKSVVKMAVRLAFPATLDAWRRRRDRRLARRYGTLVV
jgi:alpha-1,3-rhamnosyltransferase